MSCDFLSLAMPGVRTLVLVLVPTLQRGNAVEPPLQRHESEG